MQTKICATINRTQCREYEIIIGSGVCHLRQFTIKDFRYKCPHEWIRPESLKQFIGKSFAFDKAGNRTLNFEFTLKDGVHECYGDKVELTIDIEGNTEKIIFDNQSSVAPKFVCISHAELSAAEQGCAMISSGNESTNSENDEFLRVLNDALEKPVGRQGETIKDYITTAIEDCIRAQGVDSWLPMGSKGGRLCVGLYFQGVAARICNEFSLDETTSKVALAFSLINSDLFVNFDTFISELKEIADYPAVLDDENSYGSGNLLSIFQAQGAESAAEWIGLNFSKPFPTEKLRKIMDVVENYAVAEVNNPVGSAAMNNVMRIVSTENLLGSSITPTITKTSCNGAFAMENSSQQPPANGNDVPPIENGATDSDGQSFEELTAQMALSNDSENTAEQESEPSRLDIILDFLTEEGFRPEKVSETSIRFKYEGKRRWVDINESDTTWYQVIAANFWEIESEDELKKAYEAANLVSRSLKNVKAYVLRNGENVWVEFGSFYDSVYDLLPHLLRMINIVNSGAKKFTEFMQNVD